MRTWIAASIIACLAASSCQAMALGPQEFGAPVQAEGEVQISDASWALILLPPGGAWNASVAWDEGILKVTEYQHVRTEAPAGQVRQVLPDSEPEQIQIGQTQATSFGTTVGWSMVYLEGAIHSSIEGATQAFRKGSSTEVALPPEFKPWSVPAEYRAAREEGVLVNVPGQSTIDLSGPVDLLAYHNMTLPCDGCPSPAWHEEEGIGASSLQTHRFHEVSSSAQVRLSVQDAWLFLGWPDAQDLRVNGTLRLPGLGPDGETLRVEGYTEMLGFQVGPEAGFRANVQGAWAKATLDEAGAPELVRSVPAVMIGASALGILWFGGWLISRQLLDKPLKQKHRQQIADILRAEGGMGFRELRRRLGIGNGTLSYHVHVLKKAGLVQSHTQSTGAVLCLSEDSPGSAVQTKILRNPAFLRLYRLLDADGPIERRSFIRLATQRLDWPRTTTQYRFNRLVEVGLAKKAQTGLYAAQWEAERSLEKGQGSRFQ